MLVRLHILIGCVFLLLTATSAMAGAKTDLVVLKNGDRLTCEIKGLSSGVLRVSLDYAIGNISVEWSQVVRLESTRTFILKDDSGSVYRGTVQVESSAPAGPMTIKVLDGSNPIAELDQSRVIAMDPTSEAFWQQFSGSIAGNFAYFKGNQATQYSLGAETEYLQERWSGRADFSSNLASSSGDTVSTRHQFRVAGRHLMPRPNYFYGGLLALLQSSEQGIQLQTSLGGGVGRIFKNTNSASIAMIAGLALQRTRYNPTVFSQPAQDVASALIGIELKFFRFDKTNLNIVTDVFPAISDPGRLYSTTNASYFVKLFGKLSWNISAYANVDTRPPVHFSGSDYGTSSGLSLSFGNR